MQITLGDIIGYALAIILSFSAGIFFDKFLLVKISNKLKINQNKNVVKNGDIIGGNKIRKSYSEK